METVEEFKHTQSVKKRRVFYIPGYDPIHPRRYRELFRKEGADQAKISGYKIDLKPKTGNGSYGWHASTNIDGAQTDAQVDVLPWFNGWSVTLQVLVLYGVLGVGLFLYFAVWAVVAIYILRWFQAKDGKFFAYYLMHDFAYSARWLGANPPALEDRMSDFGEEIAQALMDDVDEVLVVGHSSGAHLSVSILADLIRAGRVPDDGPKLAFLSLGQVVPMVSFLPKADRLRRDLHDLSASDALTWVDVTAPGDGCAFALCDPVSVSGVEPEGKKWPLVFSAAFTQSLSPERWKELRWRFFRLHFQYLCAFDRPKDYDYFQITAGPLTLHERYHDRPAVAVPHRCCGFWLHEHVMIPPKPPSRPDKVSLLKYLRLFRQDILSAQPAKLYRAWMAEFKTPFFRSYMINQPSLVKTVLNERPRDFPKSDRIGAGLRPLLGNSVFLTNGETWERQRRIIDPAFEGGRLRDTFPAMWAAGEAATARLDDGVQEVEEVTSFAAADVIFRTLFSIPIEDKIAQAVFTEFRDYQRTQPILNLAAFIKGPSGCRVCSVGEPRKLHNPFAGSSRSLPKARMAQINAGTAPDDLATKIMTTEDPHTGETFTTEEMVDQVAIFFLAGHETSASALAWTLYLLAMFPEWQDKLAEEAKALDAGCDFKWHLHRHERLWDNPDGFDPARWTTDNGKQCMRDAFIPFSSGPRVCTGAGFAMVEGPLLLSMLVRNFKFETTERTPVPVAHLTVRSKDGIWLKISRRSRDG
ncbi:Cytochrome P450 4A7 [Nymphon striatum]|nr:Cytochrome P450 4A7 [Nymphon striatum]